MRLPTLLRHAGVGLEWLLVGSLRFEERIPTMFLLEPEQKQADDDGKPVQIVGNY